MDSSQVDVSAIFGDQSSDDFLSHYAVLVDSINEARTKFQHHKIHVHTPAHHPYTPRIARPVHLNYRARDPSLKITTAAIVVLTLEPRASSDWQHIININNNNNNINNNNNTTHYKPINEILKTPATYDKVERVVCKLLNQQLHLPDSWTRSHGVYDFVVEFHYVMSGGGSGEGVADTITVTRGNWGAVRSMVMCEGVQAAGLTAFWWKKEGVMGVLREGDEDEKIRMAE